MQLISRKIFIVILVMMLGYGASLQTIASSSLPAALSKATGSGIVDDIHKGKRNEIVVGDLSYKISPTLVVRSLSGQMLGGIALLGTGKRIAYRTSTDKAKGHAYLVEAWLLPASFKIPEEWQ